MPEPRSYMAMRTTAFISTDAEQFIRGRVLDAGSGAAPYKRLFATLVDSWTTLDARPVADILGDFDRPIGGEYDTVLCTDALQFSRDPKAAVANLTDALADGGHLIITAPNCWMEDTISRWRFTIGGLGEMVTEAGLEIVYLDGLNGLWTMEGENAHMIGEYASAVPGTFRGFIDAMDKRYPMMTACIARKQS